MNKTDFVEKVSQSKFPKRSSVSSLGRFMNYKKGLTDGIGLMVGWAAFYEQNKYRMYVLNKLTEENLLEMYFNTLSDKPDKK